MHGKPSHHLWPTPNSKFAPQIWRRTRDLLGHIMCSCLRRMQMGYWKISSQAMICMVCPVRSRSNVQGTRTGLIVVFGLLCAGQTDRMLVMSLCHLLLPNLLSYSQILLKEFPENLKVTSNARSGDVKAVGSGRSGYPLLDNGVKKPIEMELELND